ncbi:unnamed protein product [Paramecium sonneborni]|uniref:Uncharacterized protein n=1 Tax=Paramecium sonneborni TaxID=65129 RepID=A0A8S1NQR3_9CILI|nr:unnamed protein product [Paramecium sonneborni]
MLILISRKVICFRQEIYQMLGDCYTLKEKDDIMIIKQDQSQYFQKIQILEKHNLLQNNQCILLEKMQEINLQETHVLVEQSIAVILPYQNVLDLQCLKDQVYN